MIVGGGGIERSAQEYESHYMLSDMKFVNSLSSELLEHTVTEYGDSSTSLSVSDNTTKLGKTYRSYELTRYRREAQLFKEQIKTKTNQL